MRPGKEVVVKPDNDDKYIDVNDEPSDDDFVDMGRNTSYASVVIKVYEEVEGTKINKYMIQTMLRQWHLVAKEKVRNKEEKDQGKQLCQKQKRRQSSPKALCNAMLQLKPNQKACLEEIGFHGMVEFKIDGEMLGLKNKGLDILEGNPNRDDEMVRNWKQQYGDDKEIKPTDVKIRMRKSAEADLNFKLNFIVLFTSIMGNIHQKGKTTYKVWTAELLSEREDEELNCEGFGHGELEEDFVDEEGDPIPNNIEGCIWMLNNYVKNITKERKGFEKMLIAAEHMFPGNVNLIGLDDKYINSLKCTSGGNNAGTNETMSGTQEKEKYVQGEAGCTNMNRVEALNDVGIRAQRNEEVEVGVSDIGVNEQTPGSGKDLMGITKNMFADLGQDTESLCGFDRQENMCGLLTQKAFESVADEVELSIEKSKIMEMDDRPSFSFGVTQDFDVIPGEASDVFMFHGRRVTSKSNIMRSHFYNRVADANVALSSEESKVTKYLFLTVHESDTGILFKSKSGQQSNRLQMESLEQDYVKTNILDTWAAVRNYMEEYRSNDSPFRLFLTTFVVDKDSFSQIRNHDGRFEIGAQHVESVIRATSELNKLKKIDLVFLPVDNEGHRFVLTFDLKYGAVTMFDQNKKDKIIKK
ncbi:hypothetical protein Tco_1277281, partial [Tanacetum coccineum]